MSLWYIVIQLGIGHILVGKDVEVHVGANIIGSWLKKYEVGGGKCYAWIRDFFFGLESWR